MCSIKKNARSKCEAKRVFINCVNMFDLLCMKDFVARLPQTEYFMFFATLIIIIITVDPLLILDVLPASFVAETSCVVLTDGLQNTLKL